MDAVKRQKRTKVLRKIFGPVRVGDDYRIRTNRALYELFNDVNVAKRINEFEVLNKFFHRFYLNSIENNLKSKFWTYINKKRNTTGFPKCVSFNNESSKDTSIICKYIESYFKSVYTESTANPLNFMNTPILAISSINVKDSDWRHCH